MKKHSVPPGRRFAAFLAGLVLTPLAVHAQATWIGATSNDYGLAENWSTGVVPANTTEVIIDSSVNNPAVVTGNWDRAPGGGGALTTVTDTGVISVESGAARFLSNGTFTMSGGTFFHSGEYFIVGHNGLGTFNHSAGDVTSNHRRGFFLSNNNVYESGSTYNLSGGSLIVNSESTGVPEAHLRSVWFGKGASGAGELVGDRFHATGGTATFTRTGTEEANVLISRNSKLQVSGTSVVSFANYSNFYVGYNAAGTTQNEIIVDGGTLNITGDTSLFVGREDAGILSIHSGTLDLEGFLVLGSLAGMGTVTMTGGSLFAESISAQNEGSSFHFSGGTITLDGDQTFIVDEVWFNGEALAVYDAVNDLTVITVPEPGVVALLVAGGFGALAFRRRLRRMHV